MHIFWQLKFFTGDQTWTVSGQMATKDKVNLEGCISLPFTAEEQQHKTQLPSDWISLLFWLWKLWKQL